MRKQELERKTRETEIFLSLNLDGKGCGNIKTTIPFFDHILSLIATHSQFDLEIKTEGDLPHHIIEDVGICLGVSLDKALGDKKGIKRYGDILLPMDEALVGVSLDISGRPNLVIRKAPSFELTNLSGMVDGFDLSLLNAFLKAFVDNAKLAIHFIIFYGDSLHHIAEAMFKGLARSLHQATRKERQNIPSSKGLI